MDIARASVSQACRARRRTYRGGEQTLALTTLCCSLNYPPTSLHVKHSATQPPPVHALDAIRTGDTLVLSHKITGDDDTTDHAGTVATQDVAVGIPFGWRCHPWNSSVQN